ncbi:MAG: acyltransferase family protein [Solirubrobacteraceae bacterium]
MTTVAAPATAPHAAAPAAPDAVAPPPGHPRFPLIDSLRAIAALSVVLVHSGGLTVIPGDGFVSHAEAGVAVFFAISGFLLYRPFVSARLNGARRTSLCSYVRRRLLRIVPAYWLALTVLSIWPGHTGVFTGHFWIFYGFGQIYNDGYVLQGIAPAWTLCIEITFYALLPLWAAGIGLLVGRLARGRQVQVELAVIAAIGAASLAYRVLLREHASLSWVLNALPTHMDWFAPGMALAVLSAHWQDRPLPRVAAVLARWPALCVTFAAGAYTLVSLTEHGPQLVRAGSHPILLYTAPQDLARHVLYAATAAGLLTPAVIGAGGTYRRLLGWRVLAWLGLISYGIYLWHQNLLVFICQPGPLLGCAFHGLPGAHRSPLLALFALGALAAVACAAVSYYALERPILRLKR